MTPLSLSDEEIAGERAFRNDAVPQGYVDHRLQELRLFFLRVTGASHRPNDVEVDFRNLAQYLGALRLVPIRPSGAAVNHRAEATQDVGIGRCPRGGRDPCALQPRR